MFPSNLSTQNKVITGTLEITDEEIMMEIYD